LTLRAKRIREPSNHAALYDGISGAWPKPPRTTPRQGIPAPAQIGNEVKLGFVRETLLPTITRRDDAVAELHRRNFPAQAMRGQRVEMRLDLSEFFCTMAACRAKSSWFSR